MKIVHVNAGGELGGAKSHLLALLPKLRTMGLDASLLCFAKGLLSEQAESLGVPTHCLGIAKMVSPQLIVKLYRYIKDTKPDVIHTHGGRANLYGRIAAKLAGVPHVFSTVHSHTDLDYTAMWQNIWFAGVDKATWGLADGIIAVSHQLMQTLIRRGLPEHKLRVVHNGMRDVAPTSFSPHQSLGLPANSKVLCFIGRLVPVKRVDVLLEAMQEVVAAYPEVVLLIVGDGPLDEQLREKACSLSLGGHVFFVGYRREAREIMQAADAFVLSSDMEGLPVVLLEALAAQTPIIATSVGGVPEMLSHNVNALLVPARDPHYLASSILQVLRDPASARARALKGREWFEHYGTDKAMAQNTVAVYKEWGVRL